jgi:hypothetical protein
MSRVKQDSDVATAWGLCAACRSPGLALVSQFARREPFAATCGFCGGALNRVDDDLSELAAAVVAATVHGRRVDESGR